MCYSSISSSTMFTYSYDGTSSQKFGIKSAGKWITRASEISLACTLVFLMLQCDFNVAASELQPWKTPCGKTTSTLHQRFGAWVIRNRGENGLPGKQWSRGKSNICFLGVC